MRLEKSFSAIRDKVWENRRIIVLLIVIFLLAFSIRGHLLRYEYLFEFDAYYHARMAEEIVKNGFVPAFDPQAYYQIGGAPTQQFTLYWLVSAVIYNIAAMGQPFSLDLFMRTIQFMPTIFGALICFFMYWLGKEVFNSKKAGLVVAFIAAVTPAFAYRTMAGAQGDNSFGFLWMALGLIFFVRAVKTETFEKKDLINAAIAGVFFGIMAMSWTMYVLIPTVLIPYFIFAILLIAAKPKGEEHGKKISNNKPLAFAVKFAVSFAIFSAVAYAFGKDWIGGTVGNLSIAAHVSEFTIILAGIAAIVVAVAASLLIHRTGSESKKIVGTLAIIGLYAGLIGMAFVFSIVPDLHDRSTIASMVGEESMGIRSFGTKYNALIIFPVIALILLPISLYIFRKKDSHTQLIFFFWMLITLFMAWYWLKYTFVFGLGLVPAAGFLCYLIFESLGRLKAGNGIEVKALVAAFFFLMLLGVGASSVFFPDYQPYNDEHPEWVEAMDWITANTPLDAKLFNWWDQGHIISFITGRKVSTDNRNQSIEANKAMALFVISEDVNQAYQIVASKGGDYNMDADYVVVSKDMLLQGTSFAFYAQNKVDYGSKEVTKFLDGPVNILGCSDQGTSYNCNGNQITKEDFARLPTQWTHMPTQFYNGSTPMYLYTEKGLLFVFNKAVNSSNLAKVWFHSEDTKGKYEEVFSNGSIKVFKVLK